MGIYDRSSSSGGGGLYSRTSGSSGSYTPAPKKKGKSFGGFLGNLASGAQHSITGMPGGLEAIGGAFIHDISHPSLDDSHLALIAEEIGKSYAKKYGPAIHGHIGKTLNEVYKDPFGTALDATVLASGGVAAATKIGLLSKAADDISLASVGGSTVERAVRGTQLTKRLKLGMDANLKRLPSDFKFIGENARHDRLVSYRLLKRETGLKLGVGRYHVALSKLSEPEANAAHILEEFPTRKLVEEEKARLLREVGPDAPIFKMYNDPEILGLVDSPTAKMLAYLPESASLGQKAQDLLTAGVVHKKPDTYKVVYNGVGKDGGTVSKTKTVKAYSPEEAGRIKLVDPTDIISVKLHKSGDIPALTSEAAAQRRYQPALITRGAKVVPVEAEVLKLAEKLGVDVDKVPKSWLDGLPHELVAPEGQTIPGMIHQIAKEIDDEGRHQPIYHPQHMGKESGGQIGTGGVGVTQSPAHMNRGILQTFGKVAYNIDTLTPAYMKAVKFALYSDRHNELMTAAVKVKDGTEILGKGPGSWILRSRAEKISHTERMTPEFDAQLEKMFPSEEINGKADLLTDSATDANILTDANGYRLWVPKATADKIVGEYTRSSNAAKWIWEKPTTVWRHLVLNLRVGWLTNNIVGNTMMYAIRMNGPLGLRTYLNEIGKRFGPAYVKKMVDGSGLSLEDKARIFPEQISGTQYGTQVPDFGAGKVSQLAKKAEKYTTAPLRRGDIAYEQTLRGGKIDEAIQSSPQFKQAYKELRDVPRKFRREKASLKALEDNPKLVERVSDEVNATLGNFLQMTHFEQSVLRQASPFYAWYREIAKITLRMPLEYPGRTLALEKLGEIGFGENVKKLGPNGIENYLRALIPLGSEKAGRILGLNTGGLNPYMTVPQEATAIKALLQLEGAGVLGKIPGVPFGVKPPNSNDTQSLLGMINPLVGGPLQTLTGAKGSVVSGLPETRLLLTLLGQKSKPTATYNKTRLSEILSYLGVPVKDVNLYNARDSYYKFHNR